MQLTPHFTLEEFENSVDIPFVCVPAYIIMCEEILEPVRAQFGKMLITSGYRDPQENASVHGQPNSEHMATPDWCAADFFVPEQPVRPVFDWMRLNPSLPYHQLILEHGANSDVIHVSWNRTKPGVRSVLEGATHNAEPYVQVDHVAWKPPNGAVDIRDVTAD